MALQPLSTVVETYVNNIGYRTQNSVVMANAFVEAAMQLQVRRAEQVTVDGQVVKFDQQALATQIAEAKQWVASNDTSASAIPNAGTRYYDHSNIRG